MAKPAFTFFRYEDFHKKMWDRFVLSQPTGSIHQISDWKHFQQTIPGRKNVLGFGLKNTEGQIVATTWCVQMHTGFFNKFWFYSARGPVFGNIDAKAKNFFLKSIAKELQKEGGIFWRLDPYFQEEDWHQIKGLSIGKATKNFQPTDQLLLDLTLDESAILAQMKRTGRRNLKKAQKADLNIKKFTADNLTPEAIKIFYSLNQETTKRDKFHGHEALYYENFIKHLAPKATLYLVYAEETPIAAAITTFCGQKAIYYFGASTSDPHYRELRAPYLLQWEMIKDAQKFGCKSYDFTGITPINEPNHPYKGITQFKTRFGGYRATYAAGKEIRLNTFWYRTYQLVKALKR